MTSSTVQRPHSDGCAHWVSSTSARSSARAARSAWTAAHRVPRVVVELASSSAEQLRAAEATTRRVRSGWVSGTPATRLFSAYSLRCVGRVRADTAKPRPTGILDVAASACAC